MHNFYGSGAPSGENRAFEAEVAMLRASGVEVELFVRSSDEIRALGVRGSVLGGLATPWNLAAYSAIRNRVRDFSPDIVHVHNTFPLLSPSIFYGIGRRVAKVLTLHNYRIFCPAAIPLRAGLVCTECLDQYSSLPSLKYGCYRGSRVATLPLAVSVGLHRWLGTWEEQVDAFLCLSAFQRDILVRSGLPDSKTFIKPNFFPGTPAVPAWSDRKARIVYVGRLSSEKGVESLIEAWRQWGDGCPELHLIGDGDLRRRLEELCEGLPIKFLGQLPQEQAQAEIAASRLLILPSECFEGFPMVLREAFAFGTPVAVSNAGPLPSIVQDGKSGIVFNAGSSESLLKVVKRAWFDQSLLVNLGEGARREFEEKYTEVRNFEILMGVYARAISNAERRGGI